MAKGPFVLFYGDDDFLLDRELLLARNQKKRQVILIDGQKSTEEDVVSACETRFLEDRLISVVIEDAHKVKASKTKALRQYIEDKSSDDTSVLVVALLRAKEIPAMWASAGAKGVVKQCKSLAPWETSKMEDWIQGECTRLGLKIDPTVVTLFVRSFGVDRMKVAMELRKMALVLGPKKADAKDFVRLVSAGSTAEPYMVAEAALSKNSKEMMRLVSVVFRYMGEGAFVPIVVSLMRQVERLLVVRDMLDKGASEDVISKRLGMHPYRFKQSMLPLAAKHTTNKLLKEMRNLCELESQIKGGAGSKRTKVELALLSLSS